MITHEKYLSLGSTKSNEIGKNTSHCEKERQDLYFHPDVMMNQKNDDGDVDMYHNEDGDVDTYHNEEKGTAAVTTTTTTTSTTCPLQPQDVWNHFFELCSTISSAKTSAEIQSSILSLRENIFTEENRRKGLHWVKCMRDVVNLVYRLRLERPSLWTKYSGERVRRSFKVSSWEHSWIRESHESNCPCSSHDSDVRGVVFERGVQEYLFPSFTYS